MTIHSDWARILHDECPEAFTLSKPPNRKSSLYQVGVIDGHLQLMRLDTRMQTWECFIRNQFLKPIQEMFSYGCPRVVLCFDDYASVPLYKAMTQNSRTNKSEVKTFGAHEELPATIPEDPMQYLMNRNFKLKLIDMLCQRIPHMLKLQSPQHEFILDYKMVVHYDCFVPPPSSSMAEVQPTVYSLIPSPVVVREMHSMGESDVKFIRYVKKYGNALVHAIDGDYMAIALLYYSENDIQTTNKIFIYRQFSVLQTGKKAKEAKEAAACEKKKRKRAEAEEEEEEAITKEKSQKKKCWVDMQLLYVAITQAMRQCGYTQAINAKTLQPFDDKDAVFTAIFLMLCAGTDFSRNIPLIGPKKIWDYLPEIALPAMQALRGGERVNETMILNMVIGKMYNLTYSKHIGPLLSASLFEKVTTSLRGSGTKLSQGTKDRLPSVERVRNTIKNLIWVTKYWTTDNGQVETPLEGEYGFARDEQGKMNFQDLIIRV